MSKSKGRYVCGKCSQCGEFSCDVDYDTTICLDCKKDNYEEDHSDELHDAMKQDYYDELEEKNNTIITICGSTRFKDKILQVAKELTLEGYVVLLPLVFAHSGDEIRDYQKEELDFLHLRKIDLSSEVHVVMENGYIGESTTSEIKYATEKGLKIVYHDFKPSIYKLIHNQILKMKQKNLINQALWITNKNLELIKKEIKTIEPNGATKFHGLPIYSTEKVKVPHMSKDVDYIIADEDLIKLMIKYQEDK